MIKHHSHLPAAKREPSSELCWSTGPALFCTRPSCRPNIVNLAPRYELTAAISKDRKSYRASLSELATTGECATTISTNSGSISRIRNALRHEFWPLAFTHPNRRTTGGQTRHNNGQGGEVQHFLSPESR